MGRYERAFATIFGQDVHTFTGTMILNLDQLEQLLDQGEFPKIGFMAAFCVINKQLQVFFDFKFTEEYAYDSQMTKKCFADCGKLEGELNSFSSFSIYKNFVFKILDSSLFNLYV